ncbi:MAG: zinc ribbon domain-containing protein [Armatimonadota bacterium]|nr:zinc ribbon domain-containing protein [bacterium]
MPIYEFKCKACEGRFELLISLSRVNEAMCPVCGSNDVKRLMSTFAAHVSGHSSSHSSNCAGCASGHCGSCGCGH